MFVVTQYQRSDGVIPFKQWFDSLESKAAVKIRTAIAQMELGNFGDHKSVGKGVFERRLHFQQGYRVYFAKDGPALVLLIAGGTKARQQADIERAHLDWSDYKTRKRSESEQSKPNRNPSEEKHVEGKVVSPKSLNSRKQRDKKRNRRNR